MSLREIYRIYDTSAQPAPRKEIERVLYGERVSPMQPLEGLSEESFREDSNGALGGKRADRIRRGMGRESRNVINKRVFSKASENTHPASEVVFINNPTQDSIEAEKIKRRTKPRPPKGGRSPQCLGKRRQ